MTGHRKPKKSFFFFFRVYLFICNEQEKKIKIKKPLRGSHPFHASSLYSIMIKPCLLGLFQIWYQSKGCAIDRVSLRKPFDRVQCKEEEDHLQFLFHLRFSYLGLIEVRYLAWGLHQILTPIEVRFGPMLVCGEIKFPKQLGFNKVGPSHQLQRSVVNKNNSWHYNKYVLDV